MGRTQVESRTETLPYRWYVDPEIAAGERERIFRRSWQYAGHLGELDGRASMFPTQVGGLPVVVVRDKDDSLRAFLNVCRHRGSRICDAATGHESRLTCRYHGWTYGLDGSLKAASRVREGFDRAMHGLRRLHLGNLDGLLFINFDDDPPDFGSLERAMAPGLLPYGLATAKVAHRQNYPIASNWKLAIENYCECYHCQPAHPEYSVGHGRALPNEECDAELAEVMAKAPSVGLTQDRVHRSWLFAEHFGLEHGFDRYPLLRGHVTGSRDGKAVAPFLGTITGYDGGATDWHLGPLTFALAYCDHVVVYRFAPRGQYLTDCEITWLVNGNAVEGRDYELAELVWLWDVTTVADKTIIERNQAGVDSRYYVPGPLSPPMEYFTQQFLDWYIAVMRRNITDGLPGRRSVATIRTTAEGRK